MDAHMIDSAIFGHNWTTPESRALFGEEARVARWLDIVIALAQAQGECGIIPTDSADAIAQLRQTELSIGDIATGTRETSHSTLGMIRVLRDLLPDAAAEHVYFGATVQDITDTSQVLELRDTGSLLWRDLWLLEDALLQLAVRHRDTPMAGRTHGQLGSPISFGFKVASWADEVGRHLQRMGEGRSRWLVGQLGGAVGTLGFFGDRALDLRAAFCRRLGLGEPDIAWLSSRDRLAEFTHLIAMSVTSLARIANEVYVLQRREVGELAERTSTSTVGSITMPHKRNPERSEHLGTLARVVRHDSALVTESLVHEGERDGRSWKVEWQAIPGATLAAAKAVRLLGELVDTMRVVPERMLANLDGAAGAIASERVMLALAPDVGRRTAHRLVHEATMAGAASGISVRAAILGSAAITAALDTARLTEILDAPPDTGACAAMVDRLLAGEA